MNKPQLDRIRKAARDLSVYGPPNTPVRKKLIEEAIALIQADGAAAFREEYIGAKNYAHFGDQEISAPYGMGPRHGTIVFSIGRPPDGQARLIKLGPDHIYLLEAVRDFGGFSLPEEEGDWTKTPRNLLDVIREYDQAAEAALFWAAPLIKAQVESSQDGYEPGDLRAPGVCGDCRELSCGDYTPDERVKKIAEQTERELYRRAQEDSRNGADE